MGEGGGGGGGISGGGPTIESHHICFNQKAELQMAQESLDGLRVVRCELAKLRELGGCKRPEPTRRCRLTFHCQGQGFDPYTLNPKP